MRQLTGCRYRINQKTVESMKKEEIVEGLKSGRRLICDRKDAKELPMLLEMEEQGLIKSRLLEYDEQSSALEFRWAE